MEPDGSSLPFVEPWARRQAHLCPTDLAILSIAASSQHTRSFATSSIEDAIRAPVASTTSRQTRPSTRSDLKDRQKLEWAVKKHLERMDDPFIIAQHVSRTLAKDRYDEALLLVQQASKTAQCVVSWNHLIDFQMKNQKLNAAVRLLNDMKKRGQHPDELTYTIIFRGCARSTYPKLAVAESVRLYKSMTKDARLKPNIIHLNAVLQACGRAGDLDAMFSLLDSLDDSKLKPDTHTYTAILQSLRASAEDPASTKTASQQLRKEHVAQTIERCKSLWEEVMRNWRKGDLVIDEHLVCAMGRVLLLDKSTRSQDILVLAAETMNLPRLDKDSNAKPHDAVDPAPPSLMSSSKRTAPYAVPGKNTLSLLITILTDARLTRAGIRYWHHILDTYAVKPDAKLWEQMLRLLHLGRASADAASLAAAIPPPLATPYFFRLALATCLRDKNSPRMPANAAAIVDSMSAAGRTDPKSLALYLQLVQGRGEDFSPANMDERKPYCKRLADALDKVWEPYRLASESVGLPRMVESRKPWIRDTSAYERRQRGRRAGARDGRHCRAHRTCRGRARQEDYEGFADEARQPQQASSRLYRTPTAAAGQHHRRGEGR
ncbi:pentatricopeptide repeat protein [Verticillium alfalfae VaMs.102]|uniref:Pentatricopeptide repeat protein n=1 Tax=Verticillium alfalfae (strain VaMs.102 / ATCC MYA-4576 / FGSC 10136) TaxID=526221 RepID=C9SR96_VERA1|nr:pentatricopeptide repeat protein [Verticillium alfalfae VaMs.102]EEY20898.1 pentatricopeptide repeat protein [Verticillium alfalfae VaMs.102]